MQTFEPRLRRFHEALAPEGTRNLVLRFNNMPVVQLLNGNRFILSSSDGDISVVDHGFYRNDTRFLSYLSTKINGKNLNLLNSNYSTPFSAEFYLSNPELKSDDQVIPKEALLVAKNRLIDKYFQEDFYVFNVSRKPVNLNLSFEMDVDFLDLFEVKEKVFKDRPDMDKPDSRQPKF